TLVPTTTVSVPSVHYYLLLLPSDQCHCPVSGACQLLSSNLVFYKLDTLLRRNLTLTADLSICSSLSPNKEQRDKCQRPQVGTVKKDQSSMSVK
ncbi:hypothetical protein BgiBS90_000261, partial [Biomphalaria glabrata]